MTPFEETLSDGGPLLPAWDDDDVNARTLRLYAVGSSGARFLASADVPPAEREAMTDRLLDRGLRIGRTYGSMPFVWVMDEQGCSIWSRDGVVAEGDLDTVTIAGRKTPRREVIRVDSFIDPEDRGHRGVRIVLRDGNDVTVVEERDRTPHLDPTYGHDNELMDSMWMFYAGTYLAGWLEVDHVEPFRGLANEQDLAVRRCALDLAREVERAPSTGTFAELQRPSGGVTLRVAANPLDLDRRFLEVRVATPGGKSASGRWIRQGSNARIAGFLRDVATPRVVLRTMHDLLKGLKRDDEA